MNKKFITFGILFVVMFGFLVPNISYGAEDANSIQALTNSLAKNASTTKYQAPDSGESAGGWVFKKFIEGISNILLSISALILGLVGSVFDYIVQFTIIDMAKNLGGELGKSISSAWATIRDLANICFIFVLLYAAFQTVFNASFGKFQETIKNIIIIALLINFSLFFTKVVIDASNVVSTGFYNSIANSNSQTAVLTNGTKETTFKGISGGYMRMLGLQTFWGAGTIAGGADTSKIFTIGFMGSIFMLITAVILFVSAMMFVARFVILIFLMILSPLACIAFIIPGQSNKFTEFIEGLKNQAFFAPLFFALTWIVFKVGKGLVTLIPQGSEWGNIANNPQSSVVLVVNYIILMGLATTALAMSKTMATAGQIGGYFKKVSAGATMVGAGGVAVLGRQTIGRAASRLAESQGFQNLAARSATVQKLLEGTRGIAKSSFDARSFANTGIGKSIGADNMMGADILGTISEKAKGGFDARLQRQIKSKEAFAQTLTTDQQKQNYAARQMGGIKSLVTKGGSRSSLNSLFGSIGRSNRVVASKILNNQLQPNKDKLDNLTATDKQLNTQLTNANNELANYNQIVNQGGQLNSNQSKREAMLNGGVNVSGSIANIQDQIQKNQNQINSVQPIVQNLENQINQMGLKNNNNLTQLTSGQQAANNAFFANLTPQQRLANLQAQLNGQPLPHSPPHKQRPLRADEQNY